MYGRSADDLILEVPLWTKIYQTETKKLLWIIEKHWEQCLIARWWRWGLWNKHFVNAQKQYSTIALKWEPWQKFQITLELQLLADVALIWAPSVWKSSLINTWTNAKAKVAEYHFTTITPNLWIAQFQNNSFSLIDIPWLIKDAHQGKGLWFDFLRHILKSRILLLTIDITRYESGVKEAIAILEELRLYCIKHYQKLHPDLPIEVEIQKDPVWVAFSVRNEKWEIDRKYLWLLINKIDLVVDEDIRNEFMSHCTDALISYIDETYTTSLSQADCQASTFLVSAWNADGKAAVLEFCYLLLKAYNKEKADQVVPFIPKRGWLDKTDPVLTNVTQEMQWFLLDGGYIDPTSKKHPNVWKISHEEFAYYAYILPRGNDEAELWFWQTVAWLWILDMFEEEGVKKWDIIQVVSPYYQEKDLFIQWD